MGRPLKGGGVALIRGSAYSHPVLYRWGPATGALLWFAVDGTFRTDKMRRPLRVMPGDTLSVTAPLRRGIFFASALGGQARPGGDDPGRGVAQPHPGPAACPGAPRDRAALGSYRENSPRAPAPGLAHALFRAGGYRHRSYPGPYPGRTPDNPGGSHVH